MADAAEEVKEVDEQIDEVKEDAESGAITEELAEQQLDILEEKKDEAVEDMTNTASHEVSMDDVTAAVDEQSKLNKEQIEAINKLNSDLTELGTSINTM